MKSCWQDSNAFARKLRLSAAAATAWANSLLQDAYPGELTRAKYSNVAVTIAWWAFPS